MIEHNNNWYHFDDIEDIDTPSLIVYKERVLKNIEQLKQMVTSTDQLRPHVKTNKSADIIRLLIEQGISKFKCATVAEAEMLGESTAADVLLAYQPTIQKLKKLVAIINAYPATNYSCLVDNMATATIISDYAIQNNLKIAVFIDLNVGMDRTGIYPAKAFDLMIGILKLPGASFNGLHAYDGHIYGKDLVKRDKECDVAFKPVEELRNKIRDTGYPMPLLIAGGSPTFGFHINRENTECSPGTFIFWDKGYSDTIPEQDFLCAALVLTRIVSQPDETKICIDLGYKSVSCENNLQNRVVFMDHPELMPYSQNEEHMVLEVGRDHNYKIGDVLFALPIHICPTVAMYDQMYLIHDRKLKDKWPVTSRGREISV